MEGAGGCGMRRRQKAQMPEHCAFVCAAALRAAM